MNFPKVTQFLKGYIGTDLIQEVLLNVDFFFFLTKIFIPGEWQPFSLWFFPENPMESSSVVQITNHLALPTSGPVSQVHELNYLLAVVDCKT